MVTKLRDAAVTDRTLQVFEGDEWEEFALLLLQERHGPLNVHKVPADDLGDLGLDYFCIAEGVVYQCYAVDDAAVSAGSC